MPSDAVKKLDGTHMGNLAHDDDATLIARSKQGDREAFNQLVERYSTQIYNYAYRMTNDPEDAKDIWQVAFIHAFRGIHSFRSDSAFSTWMFRIVKNVYLDEQKRRRARPATSLEETIETEDGAIAREVEDDSPSPEDIAQSNERRRIVQRAIAQLPVRQRNILVLYDIQGLSYEEIAVQEGINIGTVKSRLNRARRGLRDRLLPYKDLFDL